MTGLPAWSAASAKKAKRAPSKRQPAKNTAQTARMARASVGAMRSAELCAKRSEAWREAKRKEGLAAVAW